VSNIPEIKTEYANTYKKINVAGIFGGIISGGIEATIYSESRMTDRVLETEPISLNRMSIKRIIEADLIIDPMQMKAIHHWLETRINEYEKIFGHIPSPEEIDNKFRKSPHQ